MGETRGNKTDQFPWRKQAVPLGHREFSLAETKLCPRCLCGALPGWPSARRGTAHRCRAALPGRTRGCDGGGGLRGLPGECGYPELLRRPQHKQRARVGHIGPAAGWAMRAWVCRDLDVFVGVLCMGWVRRAWLAVVGCSLEKCQHREMTLCPVPLAATTPRVPSLHPLIGVVSSPGQQDIRWEEVTMHCPLSRGLGRTCPLTWLGNGDVGRV